MFVRYPCPPPLLGSFFDRILLNRKGVTLDGEFIAKNIKEKGGSRIDWGFDPSPKIMERKSQQNWSEICMNAFQKNWGKAVKLLTSNCSVWLFDILPLTKSYCFLSINSSHKLIHQHLLIHMVFRLITPCDVCTLPLRGEKL